MGTLTLTPKFVRILFFIPDNQSTIFFSIMNFVQFAIVVTVSHLGHVNCENMNLAKFDERAIINGYNAPYRPFYVQIRMYHNGQKEGVYGLCGGTIVGPKDVLTGAHCFMEKGVYENWDHIEVLVGDMSHPNYEQTVTTLSAISYTINPGYTGYTQQGYDLAMIKLNESISRDKILQLCTSGENYAQAGYPLAVCGFGYTIPHGGAASDPPQLREAQVQDTNADGSCGYDKIFNKDLQICIASIPGRTYSSTCQGDSGGPLFPLNDGDNSQEPICLYGTVSFGATKYGGTCDGDTVFNRVSYFKDWIEGQVWNN